jgi:hypothetical protein
MPFIFLSYFHQLTFTYNKNFNLLAYISNTLVLFSTKGMTCCISTSTEDKNGSCNAIRLQILYIECEMQSSDSGELNAETD